MPLDESLLTLPASREWIYHDAKAHDPDIPILTRAKAEYAKLQ
jgi:hypothetical protein